MKATGSDFALIAEASELASRFTSRWVSIATKEFQKKFHSNSARSRKMPRIMAIPPL
jgi:hypothetical protein